MISDKRVLAVTLARGGSKSIPHKNVVDLCGRPLISYTFDAVSKSKYIDDYIVSTDCPMIRSTCQNEGVDCIDRPQELASDTAKSSDALLHAIEGRNDYDIIVEVMATNPLKQAEDIDGCLELLVERKADSVVSVVQLFDHHPSRIKYLDKDGVMCDFYPEIIESRRQDLTPNAFIRNGSIYAMNRKFLLLNKTRYNKSSLGYVMSPQSTVNIDEPMDLLIAKAILEKRS